MAGDKIDNNEIEIFISSNNTQYIWERSREMIIQLSELEISLLKMKVKEMDDEEILNRQSGNGIPMGIPIKLSDTRLKDFFEILKRILIKRPSIGIEPHTISRLLEYGSDRGWDDEEQIIKCIEGVNKVTGVRLNVNHANPNNTKAVKHLHPNLALEIRGRKRNGQGELILVVLSEKKISVITIL